MEVIALITLVVLTTIGARGAAIETPSDALDLEALSPNERKFLATYLSEEEDPRTKRSDDIFSMIKSKLTGGVKSKISHIASGSAYLSGDKGHGPHYDHYDSPPPLPHHYPAPHEEKDFSFWDLNKSIFHTLFQAVKAIKGGLIAIKGHLIKGGGYIISAKGKMISAKGEALTHLGKHIAANAMLSPRHQPVEHHAVHHHEPIHVIEYGHPPIGGGYSNYGVDYHHHEGHDHPHVVGGYADPRYPSSYEGYQKDQFPLGAHQGILILKKIPPKHKDKHYDHEASHHHHKPTADEHFSNTPSVPKFSLLPDMSDIFAASHAKPQPSAHNQFSSYQSDNNYQSSQQRPNRHQQKLPAPQPQQQLTYNAAPSAVMHQPTTNFAGPISTQDNFLTSFKEYQDQLAPPSAQNYNPQQLPPLLPTPLSSVPNMMEPFRDYQPIPSLTNPSNHEPAKVNLFKPHNNAPNSAPATSIDAEKLHRLLYELDSYQQSYPPLKGEEQNVSELEGGRSFSVEEEEEDDPKKYLESLARKVSARNGRSFGADKSSSPNNTILVRPASDDQKTEQTSKPISRQKTVDLIRAYLLGLTNNDSAKND